MKFSKFGIKFASPTGITSLMEDLGNVMACDSDIIMMGGGNPAHIPEIESIIKERIRNILDSESEFRSITGTYDPPCGNVAFLEAVSALLKREYGWDLTAENICLTTGSQSAFFMLFNLLAGEFDGGLTKKISLPLAPEYIGYSDVGLSEAFFDTTKPDIELLDTHTFKYRINFDTYSITPDIGAICVSRPTNPTGNVLTNLEMQRLDTLARAHNVPLIIDGAYGTPFPKLLFTDAEPLWNENTILCLSLSKFGLPAARTGIVVAKKEIIKALARINGIQNLAPATFGSLVALEMVRSGDILRYSEDIIKPFYLSKAQRAESIVRESLKGLPFAIHKAEGALFLWLWFEGLPISSQELYERLKKKGVLVVSGHHFFPGLEDESSKQWRHKHECIRVTYSQDEEKFRKGVKIIADELKTLFRAPSH